MITGLALDNNLLLLSGILPAALLAILIDLLLGRVEVWLAPRGIQSEPKRTLIQNATQNEPLHR